jgi:mRNA interferase MazF
MKRGEVWWVKAAPTTGGEVRKRRPGVVVSNDAANEYANRVQVVPVSSKTEKLYPCEALITVESRRVKAMADQVTTVAKAHPRAEGAGITDPPVTTQKIPAALGAWSKNREKIAV